MSDKKLLIKFQADYADEFDVYGFWVTTEKEWEKHKDYVAKLEADGNITFPYEAYFGTNEALEFYNMEDYLRNFKVQEITDEQYNALVSLFGPSYSWNESSTGAQYGQILFIEY